MKTSTKGGATNAVPQGKRRAMGDTAAVGTGPMPAGKIPTKPTTKLKSGGKVKC